MAPLLPLIIVDPYASERSLVTRLALSELVSAGQLAANEEGRPAEWIMPPAGDHAPNPLSGYVVSFTRLLTRKVHSTPNTQQAEQSWLHTRRERKTCQSIFPEN
jgi:hypothetical protein